MLTISVIFVIRIQVGDEIVKDRGKMEIIPYIFFFQIIFAHTLCNAYSGDKSKCVFDLAVEFLHLTNCLVFQFNFGRMNDEKTVFKENIFDVYGALIPLNETKL